MVREKNSLRSEKCQGILFWVRENWPFEEKSGKIEINIVTLIRRNISGQIGAKDCCNQRLEAAIISEILHLCGQGNLTFIRESQGILKTDVCGNHG